LFVALHARKSHPSVINFRRDNPQIPIIIALTGTDLYRDIETSPQARESLNVATKIIALQPKAIEKLRPGWQKKARVIYQSVENMASRSTSNNSTKTRARNGSFDVCVIGHLRAVKDPFRTAVAARLLPDSSRIRVLQVGGAMTAAMASRARTEMSANKRYRWLGEQPKARVRGILAKSRLCVLSSHMEGGANVLSEAIGASVPILASRIDGNAGILGEDYPGYFEVGDTTHLARLLTLVETSPRYHSELKEWIRSLAPLIDPSREQQAWSDLIEELDLLKNHCQAVTNRTVKH
jgi:putative glycosyltransferase (TIGR04348 family)